MLTEMIGTDKEKGTGVIRHTGKGITQGAIRANLENPSEDYDFAGQDFSERELLKLKI